MLWICQWVPRPLCPQLVLLELHIFAIIYDESKLKNWVSELMRTSSVAKFVSHLLKLLYKNMEVAWSDFLGYACDTMHYRYTVYVLPMWENLFLMSFQNDPNLSIMNLRVLKVSFTNSNQEGFDFVVFLMLVPGGYLKSEIWRSFHK